MHKALLSPLHGRLQQRRAPPGQRGNGARARARAPTPPAPPTGRRGARFPLPLAADQSEGAEAARRRGSRGGAWRRRRGGGEPYNGGRVEAAR